MIKSVQIITLKKFALIKISLKIIKRGGVEEKVRNTQKHFYRDIRFCKIREQ